MLEPLFRELGFSPNEIEVYLCLADLGKASAATIAKRTSIPRTTAYSVLSSLIAKGVCSENTDSDSTYFCINSPSSLMRIVETEKDALAVKEQSCRRLIELASPLFRQQNYSVPRLQFFEGNKNVKSMLYDYTDAWHKSITEFDNTWWGYQDPSLLEEYTDWLYHHWKVRDPELKIQLFSQPAKIERKLKGTPDKRVIRSLPPGYNFSSSIWICGEYIIMLMTKQNPHYAFQIKDSVFASNLRLIFELLWTTTTEISRSKQRPSKTAPAKRR